MRNCWPTTSWSSAPARSRSGPIGGLDSLGPVDGVHLLHSMGDTFAVMRTLEETARPPRSSSAPGTSAWRWPTPSPPAACTSSRWNSCPRSCPPSTLLGALVRGQLADRGVEVLTGTTVRQIARISGETGLQVEATAADSSTVVRQADMVLVVVGVRPDTSLAASAGAILGVQGAIAVDRGMRTNLPDVFAAGDRVVTHHRLPTTRAATAS